MPATWTIVLIALAYVGLLFLVASYGDRKMRDRIGSHGAPRPLIYALSLAVYCTSWTFFGSVGLSARTGYDFLPIYIGPILMFAIGWPVLRVIVRVSKRHNITSIADFIAARYGKNQWLGAIVALIAVIGIVPYISIQLKAVAVSLHTILPEAAGQVTAGGSGDNFALFVTLAMAGFAMLFGTRHIDNTEHQDGLILAIAVESVIKLAAFLAVGLFVTFWLFGGIDSLAAAVRADQSLMDKFAGDINWSRWLTMTVLSSLAIFLLPRQFHVAVVENTAIDDVKRAAWLFPLYLVAINLFVAPIAIAGLVTFSGSAVDGDTFVLALPVSSGHTFMVLVAFIGGLSAATAMVIVETIALSIMVCNNLFVPLLLRNRMLSGQSYGDIGPLLLMVRRSAIVAVLVLAYGYYQMIASSAALAQIGLLSFAAAAQFAPAFFGGLIWKRATAFGSMAAIATGFGLWVYTLALPLFADAKWISASFVEHGPFGLELLAPRALFGWDMGDALTHGVVWSLGMNLVMFVGLSLLRQPQTREAVQAASFVTADFVTATPVFRNARSNVTVGQLQETVARYLGEERTRRSFDDFAEGRELVLNPAAEADSRVLRFAEHLLARAVGASSSRLVLALLMESRAGASKQTARLLGDASNALRHNRDLLQSAIDHVRQGIAVFDHELNLICWNRQFRDLLSLPPEHGRVGAGLDDMLREILQRQGVPEEKLEGEVDRRIMLLAQNFAPFQEKLAETGVTLDVRSSAMPDGGVVVTFADITETVDAQAALVQANETLERRVEDRTAELVALNRELEKARAVAEEANIGKTRFVAAASHDILQPLNAARLFAASLVERASGRGDEKLVRNVDASLEAVEGILNALLEISRLDAGVFKAEVTRFPLDEVFDPLRAEMTALAEAKGLKLKMMPGRYHVSTDRQLFRRLLQNLIANAIKYTKSGRVLVGCRRKGEHLRIDVLDTGPGISAEQQEVVFQEFVRLKDTGSNEHGLGLGLSIVKRIAGVLDHQVSVKSQLGKGSVFSVTVPLAAAKARVLKADREERVKRFGVGNPNILVIDNDASILEAMETLLNGWGCRVLCARDQSEAHRHLKDQQDEIDLVLADYHLDVGNGIDLYVSLCAAAGRDIPAVLITADRSDAVIEAAGESGMSYLGKPVKPAGLRAAISHLLTRREAAE